MLSEPGSEVYPWLDFYRRGQFAECIRSLLGFLARRPSHPVALRHLGLALHTVSANEEACECFRAVLAICPDDVDALVDLGMALEDLGKYGAAQAAYELAAAHSPDNLRARGATGLLKLRLGDWRDGWPLFECRWQTDFYRALDRHFPQPQWRGEASPDGKTILIHAEHAYGDTIQFCRYVPLVAAMGAQVILEVQPTLAALVATLEMGVEVIARGNALPRFDLHCPLLSLPLAFDTTVTTIPVRVPYLTPDPNRVSAARRRLPGVSAPGLKVGLVWAGNPYTGDPAAEMIDRRRSMAFRDVLAFGAVAGVTCFSLQMGEAARQLSAWPGQHAIIDAMDDVCDFADTAAIIACLDLVISVDTSVAHLAGALGKPVWVLSRFNGCWRWLKDRSDSPWYPTARLFRQPSPGDWSSVVQRVTDELHRLAQGNLCSRC